MKLTMEDVTRHVLTLTAVSSVFVMQDIHLQSTSLAVSVRAKDTPV